MMDTPPINLLTSFPILNFLYILGVRVGRVVAVGAP